MILDTMEKDRHHEIKSVISQKQLIELKKEVEKIAISDEIKNYITRLTSITRKEHEHILYGTSPRGSIGLMITSKALAFCSGRNYVTHEDVQRVALPVLRHRIILNYQARLAGLNEDQVILELFEGVKLMYRNRNGYILINLFSYISMDNQKDILDQYDYINDDYFGKAILKYSSLIGEFFMNFSYLEHELEIAIAESISDRSHDLGYLIITKIDGMYNKIDLFHKYYKMFEHFTDKTGTKLKEIVKALIAINEFRNKLAHAKWQSIQKDGTVRYKIESDKTGIIKFQNTLMTPKDIRIKIKEISKLVNKINDYRE